MGQHGSTIDRGTRVSQPSQQYTRENHRGLLRSPSGVPVRVLRRILPLIIHEEDLPPTPLVQNSNGHPAFNAEDNLLVWSAAEYQSGSSCG